MKSILVFLLFFSLNAVAQTFTGKVISVENAQIITVLDSLNHTKTIRLAEIDCPLEPHLFALPAKEFTTSQVYETKVKCVIIGLDENGNSVGMIYYGEENKYLSAEILRYGFGWQNWDTSKSRLLGQIELTSKKMGIGMWANPAPMSPTKKNN